MEKTVLFPGSFDPFTLGHKIIVDQALEIFDKVIVAVGINTTKQGLLTDENKLRLIRDVYKHEPRLEVSSYSGLTVDFCKKCNTKFVLRGMRNSVDFEFERNMMQINRTLYPELHTVLLFTPAEYVAISSSVVRELMTLGGDPSEFMPAGIILDNYL